MTGAWSTGATCPACTRRSRRRVRRGRERDRGRPALPRGARQARHRATPSWSWSTPGRSAASRTATAGSARGARVAALRPHGRQRLRAPDRRPGRRRRPEHHGGRAHRRPRRPARASGEGGDYRNGGGRPAAHRRPRRSRSPSPRARASPLDGHALAWGLDARRRLQTARGARPAPDRLDGAAGRSCHRASIAELVIPYGDTNPTVDFKNAFDIGEYGLGPLRELARAGLRLPRRDPLPRRVRERQARRRRRRSPTRSASTRRTSGSSGSTTTTAAARTDVRRARRLVISSIATVGNYEYGFFWYLGPGRRDRVRGQADRRPAHGRRARGRAAVRTRPSRAGRRRELPPALLLRAARPGRRRRAQHGSSRSTRSPSRARRATPTGRRS